VAANPNWEGNFKVQYWNPTWQSIIYGSETSYLKKIINAGFDGVYLDIIDAFQYFEDACIVAQPPAYCSVNASNTITTTKTTTRTTSSSKSPSTIVARTTTTTTKKIVTTTTKVPCVDSQANCIFWAKYCFLLASRNPHPCKKTCKIC